MKNLKWNGGSWKTRFAAMVTVALIGAALPAIADAQTVLFTGDEPLNFFSASHLTDDLALNNDPNDTTRNGVSSAGADPNALETGDGVWLRSTGRRMRSGIGFNDVLDANGDPVLDGNGDPVQEPVGLAGNAVGADGTFMTAGSQPADALDNRGHGASFVLYDAKTTTGMQTLNFSLFYNDSTPNYDAMGMEVVGADGAGGNVAVRVWGIQETGVAGDPWDTNDFTHLAGSGRSGALLSAANHRNNSGDGAGPQVDRLFMADSSAAPSGADEILNPSAEWQDLSFEFDTATGYDYLIFAFAGVTMDLVAPAIGADGFAYDNISFEPAAAGLACDLDGSGQCDLVDLEMLVDDVIAGTATAADIDTWLGDASDPANLYLGGTKTFQLGDADLNGNVDSVDLGLLLNNFGDTSGQDWMGGNMNGDANVDSVDLGLLLNNFGFASASAASVAAVPEPSSLGLLLLAASGLLIRGGNRGRRQRR